MPTGDSTGEGEGEGTGTGAGAGTVVQELTGASSVKSTGIGWLVEV